MARTQNAATHATIDWVRSYGSGGFSVATGATEASTPVAITFLAVRSPADCEGMFDVLASDESATAGEMLTASAFAEIREIVSRFYKLIFVDTGNNVRAQNWQAAMDATDQLVITMSARNDS